MGHVANAWGQLSWEDHIPYSMDTDTGLPEFSSATKFGSFNFWLTETVRHPSTVFFSFTAPRTQFCYSGCVSWFAVRATPLFLQTMTLNIRSVHREFHRCSYWDTFRCEGNYTLVDGDAFKVCVVHRVHILFMACPGLLTQFVCWALVVFAASVVNSITALLNLAHSHNDVRACRTGNVAPHRIIRLEARCRNTTAATRHSVSINGVIIYHKITTLHDALILTPRWMSSQTKRGCRGACRRGDHTLHCRQRCLGRCCHHHHRRSQSLRVRRRYCAH